AERVARLIELDGRFQPPALGRAINLSSRSDLTELLSWSVDEDRAELGEWLHREAPLARRMHRNTRDTLREYYRRGLIPAPPPRRIVTDERYDFATASERDVYEAVGAYIDRRFNELER